MGSCGRNWKRQSDGVVGELLKYQYRSKVRVVVAQTGKTLQSKTLYGTVPPCGGGGASSLDLDVKPPWKKYGLEVTAAQVNKYATTVFEAGGEVGSGGCACLASTDVRPQA